MCKGGAFKRKQGASIALSGIAGVKGQFAIHPEDLYRTVDRIDVHDTHRSRGGPHGTNNVLIRINDLEE